MSASPQDIARRLAALQTDGDATALPPTLAMRFGDAVSPALDALHDFSFGGTGDNPHGQWLKQMIYGRAPEAAHDMSEGYPNVLADTRGDNMQNWRIKPEGADMANVGMLAAGPAEAVARSAARGAAEHGPAMLARALENLAAPTVAGGPMGGQLGAVGDDIRSLVQPGRTISTRFPTAGKATEDPLGHDLKIGPDTILNDPKASQRAADLIAGRPTTRVRSGSPEHIIRSQMEDETNNLLDLYDNMDPAVREESKLWYPGANVKANQQAQRYGRPVENIAGTYAALSPQKDWFQNVDLGDRLMDIVHSHQQTPWSRDMTDAVERMSLTSPGIAANRGRVIGRQLGELTEPGDRAMWVRAFDEAHNSRNYPTFKPTGEQLGSPLNKDGTQRKIAWGSAAEIASALKSFDAPDLETISREMGLQHKVRNFYNNIVNPYSPEGFGTIDTHHVAAATMRPLAGGDFEVLQNFGSGAAKGGAGFQPHMGAPVNSSVTGAQGLYGLHLGALQDAANARGILPAQMQSPTWEAIRALFPADVKTPRNKALANGIMQDYAEGRTTRREAFERIIDLRKGMGAPTWATP